MTFFWSGNLPSPYRFHAQTFHPNGNVGLWADFPSTYSLLPENRLTLNPNPPPLPRLCQKTHTPDFPQWQSIVLDARQKIERGHFQKVVLARRTTLLFDAPVNPHIFLHHLQSLHPKASLFMLQLDTRTAFLGASPEKLLTRQGEALWTEAVAGTITAGEVWTPKETSEFTIVHTDLTEKLKTFCHHLQWHPPEERPFGALRHLSQKLQGTLLPSVSTSDLIAALHPTPALGGYPSHAALQYLRETEVFDRGFYGAPIGLISETDADIAVAIRSMLVRGNEVHLFAGAGIVPGSCPLKEWEELDRKNRSCGVV